MRCVSQSAEKQQDIEIALREELASIRLRTDHQEVEDTGDTPGTHWECEEAFMECALEDCPTVEEVEEDFDDWFEYAAGWQPPKLKSLAQIQADVEYIAALSGIDLEV